MAAMSFGNDALVRLIPDDANAAGDVLREKNIPFQETEVTTVLLENKAGELTGVAAKLSEAGVNAEAIYVVGLADGSVRFLNDFVEKGTHPDLNPDTIVAADFRVCERLSASADGQVLDASSF